MILGPSAFQLGGQVGSKIDPKSIKNWLKNRLNFNRRFDWFLEPLGGQVGTQNPPKILPKSIKILSKPTSSSIKIWCACGVAFWSLLEPTWPQHGPNIRPKWPQHGPILGGQGGSNELLVGSLLASWGLLGAKMVPRGPKAPQDTLQERFWTTFDWFLVDF